MFNKNVSVPLYYTYSQNNSGGTYDVDTRVTFHVIIQAFDSNQADARAEEIGIYFNGVSSGRDCGCCGDRWNFASHGTFKPEIYGEDAHTANNMWSNPGDVFCRVYHLNGRVSEIKQV